ncbi:hypothetical protein D3C78_276830 [compost metagenome]
MHDAVHAAAGLFQGLFQCLQGTFALLHDIAVQIGWNLGGDQHAVELGYVGRNGLGIGIRGEDNVGHKVFCLATEVRIFA